MEIQRIYSEIDTNERLYSVSLDNEELRLYSEYQKEFAVFQDISGLKKTYNKYGGKAGKAAELHEESRKRFEEAVRARDKKIRDYTSKISPETIKGSKKIVIAGEKAKARINNPRSYTPSSYTSLNKKVSRKIPGSSYIKDVHRELLKNILKR